MRYGVSSLPRPATRSLKTFACSGVSSFSGMSLMRVGSGIGTASRVFVFVIDPVTLDYAVALDRSRALGSRSGGGAIAPGMPVVPRQERVARDFVRLARARRHGRV